MPDDRSIPLVIGPGTSIRFDRADIKAVENALGIGYRHFTRTGIFGSLTATEAYLWRGLRAENEKGELVHAFPLNDAGKEQAGDLFMSFMQNGGDVDIVDTAFLDAFVLCGLFRRTTTAKTPKPEEDQPKN